MSAYSRANPATSSSLPACLSQRQPETIIPISQPPSILFPPMRWPCHQRHHSPFSQPRIPVAACYRSTTQQVHILHRIRYGTKSAWHYPLNAYLSTINSLRTPQAQPSAAPALLKSCRSRDALATHSPNILRFRGYGARSGLCFGDDHGEVVIVSKSAFAGLVGMQRELIKVVGLKGCYSRIRF